MINKFPRQKVSSNSKTKQWYRDCTIAGVDMAFNENNNIKPTHKNILENFRIYNGERDPEELKKQFDILGKVNSKYSPSFRNFSTIRDRIDELTGEYIEKGVDYVIAALDRDAINQKLEENKERIRQAIKQIYEDDSLQTEAKIKEQLEDVVDFKFMSKAEVAANKVLAYYKKFNRLIEKEIEAFREALITAVSVFKVGIDNNSLKVERCNPESIYAVRNGYSNDIKDSRMIAKVDYLPPGQIVDEYNEYLKESEQKRILKGDSYQGSSWDEDKKKLTFKSMEDLERFTKDTWFNDGATDVIDKEGNIRVITFTWAGFRLIYKRKYYDENGEVQHDFKSEQYKADKSRGEVLEKRWVREYHESTLIMNDIVCKYGINPYNFNSVHDPMSNISGYVGGYFNVGQQRAKSLIDNVKSYLYLRDMVFARLEDLMAKNMGKVIELDLAALPQGWNPRKVIEYVKKHGVLVKNSFTEGQKGRALGKIAGQYSQGTRVIDAELGISINYMLEFIRLIDDMISRVTGVTPQRLGAIHSRELVGNVERSRIQSSLITEIWFHRFETIILDLYDTMLEMAKLVVDEDDTLQFVLDDMSYEIISKELSHFKNAKFGLFPVNANKYLKLRGVLEQAAINGIANNSMSATQLISLYDSNSMSEMVDKQNQIEKDRTREARRAQEAQQQADQQKIQSAKEYDIAMKKMEHDFEVELEEIKGKYKVMIEQMKISDNALGDHLNGLLQDKELNLANREKLALMKQQAELRTRELELQEKKIAVDERKAEASMEAAKLKGQNKK